MPAPQSLLLLHFQLGKHWCEVGWQYRPAAQSLSWLQVEPDGFPVVEPGLQELRAVSHT